MRHHAHVPLSAVLLIVGSVLCFTVLDATVKVLTQRYPVPLLVWARYGVQALVMLLWLAPSMGMRLLRTRQPRLQLVRAAILPFSSLCFFTRAQVPAARRGDGDQLLDAGAGRRARGGLSRRADDAPRASRSSSPASPGCC